MKWRVACRRRSALAWAGGLAGLLLPVLCLAAPPDGETFRGLLKRQTLATFEAVIKYAADQPQAADVNEGYLWLFQTARQQKLEVEALPAAAAYLKRDDRDPQVTWAAQQVQALGLAKAGQTEEALAAFDGLLLGVRRESPTRFLELTLDLAAQLRLAGKPESNRALFERVASSFPLNDQVSSLAEKNLAKLELLNQPAPKIAASDLEGKPVDWGEYQDRVVLVDFWATWCTPCITELPNLKRLYADHHEQGFDIIGVSLDDDKETVERFQQQSELRWRMVLNEADGKEVGTGFHVDTIPALYLVDKQGRVAQFDVRGDDLRTAVERLMRDKP